MFLASAWTPGWRPDPTGRLRLFCFAHAGGSAMSYHRWRGQLPGVDVCPVELPGHLGRLDEPCITAVADLVDAAGSALVPLLGQPFALFGYSFGAVLAFELARWLRRRNLGVPEHLLVAARQAPDAAPPTDLPSVRGLSDAQFITQVETRYGALPAAVLQAPELLAAVLPVLRTDLLAAESYVYRQEAPLGCPLTVFAGHGDRLLAADGVAGWGRQTAAPFKQRWFAGGHFFINEDGPTFLAALRQTLCVPGR